MIFLLFLVFWVTACIIFYFGPKLRIIRLAGLIAFTCGLVPLAETIEEFVLPSVPQNTMWFHLTVVLIGYITMIGHYIYPCLLLLFSLFYSKLIKENRLHYLLIFIPVFFTGFFFPINLKSFPPVLATILPFEILNLWAVPYILTSNGILFYTYIRETNPVLKKQALASFVIIFFPTVIGLFFTYFYPAMFQNDFCLALILISFILPYLFFIKRYGAFGVKLNFEKFAYEHSFQLISYGASFMNHTIKNEANKIKACLTLLKDRLVENDKGLEYLNTISLSLNQILSFTELIQAKTQVFNIQRQPANLQSIVNEVMQGYSGVLETKNIKVSRKYSYVGNICVDITHIRETISNIIVNAIEAMPDGGALTIESYQQKKWIVLAICDTGTGIVKEDLLKVIEPFYSTKQEQNNYGLGLTYCYNVMQEHNGKLILRSNVGEGTTVYLKFPS